MTEPVRLIEDEPPCIKWPRSYWLIQCPSCNRIKAWRPLGRIDRPARIRCSAQLDDGSKCGRWFKHMRTTGKGGTPRSNSHSVFVRQVAQGVTWAEARTLAATLSRWMREQGNGATDPEPPYILTKNGVQPLGEGA